MTKHQRIENVFKGGYEGIEGHEGKAWKYWTNKAGIDSGHINNDIAVSDIRTDKQNEKIKDKANQKSLLVEKWKKGKTDKIKSPKTYLPAKFWNSKKWVDGMIIGPYSKNLRNRKWWFLHEEGLFDGKAYTLESESLYEVSPERSKEILSDPKWKKGVDKILRNMK